MKTHRTLAFIVPIALLAIAFAAMPSARPQPQDVFGGQEREPGEPAKTKDCQRSCEDAGGACPAGTLCITIAGYCSQSSVVSSNKCVAGTRFVNCSDPGSGNCQTTKQGQLNPSTGTCSCTTDTNFCGVKQVCNGT